MSTAAPVTDEATDLRVSPPAVPGQERLLQGSRLRTRAPWNPAWLADATVIGILASKVYVVALWLSGGGLQELGAGVYPALASSGRLTGLLAADLLLDQVLLMARIPVIERAIGQDRLTRWHRWIGFASFWGMTAHIVLIVAGYAGALDRLWDTFTGMVLEYPGMLLALAGTLALCLVVVTSVRRARRKLRYESWHLLHLYAYLGCFLALPHQLWTGQNFLASPAHTIFWWSLWIAAATATLLFRVGLPLLRSLRHDLRVDSVRPAGGRAWTVRVRGRDLHRMPVQAGQFFNWRFLGGPGWTRANPYSLSAAPDGHALEITVATVGDGSGRVPGLVPGARVLVEGPYGRLHPGVRTREDVTLIGCGVGIAPLKSVAEDLTGAVRSLTIIYRCRDLASAPLLAELDALALHVGARLVVLDGGRVPGRRSWLPARLGERTDASVLGDIVPGIAGHDVFVCGPGAWVRPLTAACRALGVPAARIHTEHFDY